MNLSKQKKVMVKAAQQAGKILLKYYGRKTTPRIKLNKTLVSKADIEANEAIIGAIKRSFPEHSVLSEETPYEDNKSDFKWVIDPLDGTHNFLHGIPIFGTSIALEYKEEVVLGVLGFPALNLFAFAEKGKGAFLNGKRLKVSDKKGMGHSFILFEYAYLSRKAKHDFLGKFIREYVDLRNFGAAIYVLLMIAAGNADGYVVFTTNEWDMAAGALIVLEAGGKITDFNGNGFKPSGGNFVISNGKIHHNLLEYIN